VAVGPPVHPSRCRGRQATPKDNGHPKVAVACEDSLSRAAANSYSWWDPTISRAAPASLTSLWQAFREHSDRP
jgi:hypothetical protein